MYKFNFKSFCTSVGSQQNICSTKKNVNWQVTSLYKPKEKKNLNRLLIRREYNAHLLLVEVSVSSGETFPALATVVVLLRQMEFALKK